MAILPASLLPDPESGIPSVVHDLRSGRAGWGVRLGLSLAAATLLIAGLMFVFGFVEMAGHRVDEAHIAIGIGFIGATWCVTLWKLWSSFKRWGATLRAIFGVMAVWAVAIPLCVFLEKTVGRAEFLIAGSIMGATAISIGVISIAAHGGAGRSLRDRAGGIRVHCPACGYSMVGLDSCQCPECGAACTIDQLIIAQDYAAVRGDATGSAAPLKLTASEDGAAQGS